MGGDLGAAQCSLCLGNILFMQNQYDKATTLLKEARVKFIELGDVLGATQCHQTLGEIRCYQGDYAEASMILGEAQEQFIEIGNRLGAAQCLQALGDNDRFEGKYVEANDEPPLYPAPIYAILRRSVYLRLTSICRHTTLPAD